MEITVRLDDEEVSKVVTQGLKALSEDEIKDIVKECIKKYFFEKHIGDKVFVDTYYDRPSKYLIELISNGFSTEELMDIRNTVFDTLKSNSDTILKEAFTRAIVEALVTDNFKQNLVDAMQHLYHGQYPTTI